MGVLMDTLLPSIDRDFKPQSRMKLWTVRILDFSKIHQMSE